MSDTTSAASSQSESDASQTPPKRINWKQKFKRKLPSTFVTSGPTKKENCTQTSAQLKRRIVLLEQELVTANRVDDCPHDLDEHSKKLASGGSIVCSKCGLSHRRAELVRIGMAIYGEFPKESKKRWITEGVSEYLHRLNRASSGSAVLHQIEDELSHVEIRQVGNPETKNRRYRPVLVEPAKAAVQLRLEEMVRFCLICTHTHITHCFTHMYAALSNEP